MHSYERDQWERMRVPEILAEMIDVRYRRKGYRIAWLLFGRQDNPARPDLKPIDARLGVDVRNDLVLSAGITRKRHAKFIYPCPIPVLRALDPVRELVLGGFHLTDCVDRVARAAHARGTPTIVDEDLTDWFFLWARLWGLPPILRTPQEFGRDFRLKLIASALSENMVKTALRAHRQERSSKPWLVPI